LPHSKTFLDTYFREIGVQTPVSLFTAAPPASSPPPDMPPDVKQAAAATVVATSASVATATAPVLKSMDELAADAEDCRLCGLCETRNNVVFGIGNPHADLVFIGEAPGRDEDLKGEPFVGRAGQLLDRMLLAIQLEREQIYIMNTIKCRPPNNRDPKADEVEACSLWFEQQLNLLQPKLICLLGRVAAQTVLQSNATLGSMRGRWHDYLGIPTLVTYHPAYLLRSPQKKYKSWQDLQALLQCYRALQ